MKTKLPVGFHRFHKNKFFNFQLNRWYSLGYTRLEDFQKAAAEITNFDDYKSLFVRLAERAIAENRLKNAAFYFHPADMFIKRRARGGRASFALSPLSHFILSFPS